ncbi:MAG: hypothetical protein LBO67_10275 [Spirochaetaceae bacterium]|jgi:hypothetical protein|nr:hypothetical protein [Spirochaetaceae bacterium]
MSIVGRNFIFKIEIVCVVLLVFLVVISSFFVIQLYPATVNGAVERSAGIVPGLALHILPVQPFAPFISVICTMVYALIGSVCIYLYFEKTESPEIFFFSFFVLSTAFEALRVITPLTVQYTLPSLYLGIAFKVLFFSRYFGIFSLFVASINAAGMRFKNSLLMSAIVALLIALKVPVDRLSWNSSLGPIAGMSTTFAVVDVGCIVITILNFFISAYSSGEKNYFFIGAGSLLVFLGKELLINADTLFVPFLGFVLLVAGTWFIATRLHKIYLWL